MDHLYSTTTISDRERGQHLTFEERCTIKVYKKLGYSLRAIASALNCSPSTVMYELRRGTGKRNGSRGRHPEYSARRGQQVYQINRSRCRRHHRIRNAKPFIDWVIKKVKSHKWSLDACVGYARKNGLFPEDQIVCTKTLYNELWAGNLPLTPFDVPEALHRSAKKAVLKRNKRVLGKSIEERPEDISKRTGYGHWEIDTVVGHRAGKEAVVLTLVEKKSDYYLAIRIPHKDSSSVKAAMETLIEEYGKEYFPKIFKTITADNGHEFDLLSEIEAIGTTVYFAHPYSSWERGQNERHNRIFRRYIPKGVSIENYSAEQIMMFADEMNGLPRRLLGYRTPEDLFDSFLDQIYSLDNVQVA